MLSLQVAAKILKAGPGNATIYMSGVAIMYKEHEILVEVNNDGSGIIGVVHCAHACILATVPSVALAYLGISLRPA